MISVLDAVVLFCFGAGVALFCVCCGAVLHMRWLDRKLIPPVKKAVAPITQQIPTVKP